MKSDVLSKLTKKKDSTEGTIKLVVFVVLAVVAAFAAARWHLKMRSLKKEEAELEIHKKHLVDTIEAVRLSRMSRSARKAWEIINNRAENAIRKKSVELKMRRIGLEKEKKKIEAARSWDELESA